MDIKSFVYFSIFCIPFRIMNIITILITLCHKYIGISRTLIEDTRGASSSDFASAFPRAAFSTLRQIPLWCSESVCRSNFSGKLERNLSPRYIFLSLIILDRPIESHLRFLSKFLKYLSLFSLLSLSLSLFFTD